MAEAKSNAPISDLHLVVPACDSFDRHDIPAMRVVRGIILGCYGGVTALRECGHPTRIHGPASSEAGPFTFSIILFPVSSILDQF